MCCRFRRSDELGLPPRRDPWPARDPRLLAHQSSDRSAHPLPPHPVGRRGDSRKEVQPHPTGKEWWPNVIFNYVFSSGWNLFSRCVVKTPTVEYSCSRSPTGTDSRIWTPTWPRSPNLWATFVPSLLETGMLLFLSSLSFGLCLEFGCNYTRILKSSLQKVANQFTQTFSKFANKFKWANFIEKPKIESRTIICWKWILGISNWN